MSSFLKVILGVFLCIAIVFTNIGVISANNDANAAASYLEYVSNEITTSNFSQDVIDELVAEAAAEPNNYTLVVTPKGRDAAGNYHYAEVELTYHYQIKLIGLDSTHVTKQIAR